LSSSNPNFLSNYLKANYVLDNSGSLLVYSNQTIIRALPSDINLGAVYPEDWPDAIQPVNGSQVCLLYRNQRIGGIYYEGIFPGGSVSGKLVFLSFALETTNNNASKDILIEDVIRFFEGTTSVDNFIFNQNLDFEITGNYPNPFNSTTKVEVYLPKEGFIKIQIFNILGEKVFEASQFMNSGKNEVRLDLQNLNSGIYLLRIKSEEKVKTLKLNLIK
jgi:hypothetical protein